MQRSFMVLKAWLDQLYEKYNRREFVHPDPVEFLYEFPDALDREIAGFLVSALAFGRVAQIHKSCKSLLRRMGDSPRDYVTTRSACSIERDFCEFRHRWVLGTHVASLLIAIKGVLGRFASLEECFRDGVGEDDDTIIPGLARFVAQVDSHMDRNNSGILASPSKGSACKKLNLYLRWMIRKDVVDPGGWGGISKAKLIVPLDVHMHRISRRLNLTSRKQANLAAALEVSAAFRGLSPEDPVRYDFAMTRPGILGLENSDWPPELK